MTIITDPGEEARRRVLAYVRGNDGPRREEIVATLEADPERPISEALVSKALADLVAEGLVFQLSYSVIDGERFAAVDP